VRAGRRSVVTPEERRQFVRDHRLAIFGYNRRKHGPAMTAVYYVMNGDNEILVSTMADRAKAKVVRQDERVSLCVLDENWPLTYIQVYGHARLDDDFETATSVLHRVLGVMAGQPMPDSSTSRRRTNGPRRETSRRPHYAVRHIRNATSARAPR
jgi:hypothetical protein